MQEIQTSEHIKKIVLRNSAIIFCSTLGSIILFSPARHFGGIAIAFIVHATTTAIYEKYFGIFCGVASVAATAIIGFNSWDKILSVPEKTFKALLRRILFYFCGIVCAIPLMIDTFKVNQPSLNIMPNLIITFLPGVFISGVYGQSIEFLYNELTDINAIIDKNVDTRREDRWPQRRIALGMGLFLGTTSAVASYWEGFNILNPLFNLSILAYIISVVPVACRAPLFIKSTYSISNKLINTIRNPQRPSCMGFTMLLVTLLFSLFTIGAYSDIAYNGMTQSDLYQNSQVFRSYIYPSLLGIAMLCMLLLNADALLAAGERVTEYFHEEEYNRFLAFKRNENENAEKILSLEEPSVNKYKNTSSNF